MTATVMPQASMLRVVPMLGTTQIIGWGSLYYSITVLAEPMAASLGLPKAAVFGGFSLGLAVSGFAAPAVGRAIDATGGRRVLAGGSLLAALALGLMAMAQGPLTFFAAWALAGAAMAACLYDAAFPTLSQVAGNRYRSSLTALTLFGGLASTVFWPLLWHWQASMGWRAALWACAAMNLLICLPLHWALPDAPAEAKRKTSNEKKKDAAGKARPTMAPGFAWLSAALALNAFVFSAVGAHVVATLTAATHSAEKAVWAAALIGPMQVAGRIGEFVFARRWPARHVGTVAFSMLVLAMLLLWQADAALMMPLVFALCYGASNGVMTIVRGMVPAELFGREAYGELMGRLARPAFFAKAAAPLLVSLFLAAGAGYAAMSLVLAALALVSLAGYGAALRAHDRSRRHKTFIA